MVPQKGLPPGWHKFAHVSIRLRSANPGNDFVKGTASSLGPPHPLAPSHLQCLFAIAMCECVARQAIVLLCLLLVQWHPSPAGFKYRFEGPDSADRGFNSFIPLAELYNPDNGYLDENDAITVEAAITTSKGTQRCNRNLAPRKYYMHLLCFLLSPDNVDRRSRGIIRHLVWCYLMSALHRALPEMIDHSNPTRDRVHYAVL
jgi:hypothetical protein